MHTFSDFSNVTVNGSTQAGKTHTVKDIMLHSGELFPTPPTAFIFVYVVWNPCMDEIKRLLPQTKFFPQLPTFQELSDITLGEKHSLMIVDDLGSSLGTNDYFMKLYCFYTHHYRVSAFLCTHDLAASGKHSSTMHKNTHSYLLLSSPRDQSTLLTLSRYGDNYKFLRDVMKDIGQNKPHRHFLINYHPKTPLNMRYLTNIIPNSPNEPLTIYMKRD